MEIITWNQLVIIIFRVIFECTHWLAEFLGGVPVKKINLYFAWLADVDHILSLHL